MNKLILSLLVFNFFFTNNLWAQNTESNDTSKHKYQVLKSAANNNKSYKLIPFYFNSFFFESIVYNFNLNKNISNKELRNIAYEIFNSINNNSVSKLIIYDYKNKKDLHFVFNIKKIKNNISIITFSNYNKENEVIHNPKKTCPDCWAMAHFIVDKKLIYSKYVFGKKKLPHKDKKTWTANYYLLDEKKDNDNKIEPLLLSDIKSNNTIEKGWSYIILTQYYLSTGNIKKANKALRKAEKLVDTIIASNPKSNFSDIVNITQEQYLATKMYY